MSLDFAIPSLLTIEFDLHESSGSRCDSEVLFAKIKWSVACRRNPKSQIPLRPFQKFTCSVTRHSARVMPLMLRKEDSLVKGTLRGLGDYLKTEELDGLHIFSVGRLSDGERLGHLEESSLGGAEENDQFCFRF